MMPHFHPVLASFAAAGVLFVAARASTSSPESNANLNAAAAAVDTAASDPAVAQFAALELQQSRQALQRAQELSRSDAPEDEVDHYAYLAARNAELAQETAKLKGAQQAAATASARSDELSRQVEKLRSQMAELGSTGSGAVLTLGSDIVFDVDGTALKPGAVASIGEIATFLRNNPERRVVVRGYTDSTGAASYNQRLSEQRAATVRDALIREGVDPARITVRGYGEMLPVASNATTAGRQMNRRVEVAISDRSGTVPPENGGASAAL
jgi:outer membrane protein OmpA-like peptidoglycan-associated protein